jgi:hypothetical protein
MVRMSDPIADFFDQLGRQGPALPRAANGTIRFDVASDGQTDRWLVAITDGDLRVSKPAEVDPADTVVRTDRAFFGRLLRGEVKPLPAWLRNDLTTEGEFRFVILLERLLPARPGQRHPRDCAPRATTGQRG